MQRIVMHRIISMSLLVDNNVTVTLRQFESTVTEIKTMFEYYEKQ